MKDSDGFGCAVFLIIALNVAWISFLVWVIYTLVTWLTSK